MRNRDIEPRDVVQLIQELDELTPDDRDRLDLFEYRCALRESRHWAERGDALRAVLGLAAARKVAPPEAAPHALLDSMLRAAEWPRPLRIQYMSDLHAAAPADLRISDIGADVLIVAGDVAETPEGLRWLFLKPRPRRTWSSSRATTTPCTP